MCSMEWSTLPSDVWCLIGSKLDTVADRVRFRAVSKDFQFYLPPFRQPIWLILPEEGEEELEEGENMRLLLDEDHQPKPKPPPPPRRIVALGEQQIHHLDLPEAHEKRCVCSAGSWLVTVDEDHNIHLLDPFTREQFNLPSQRTLLSPGGTFSFGNDGPVVLMNGFLRKLVSSSLDLDFKGNHWIAAIYGSKNRLAVCKPGDVSWTCLETCFNCEDVIYYKQQFFVVDSLGTVSTYNPATDDLAEFAPCIRRNFGIPSTFRFYLVEWMGELLLVKRLWPAQFPSPPHKTVRFNIFIRDFKDNRWLQFNNLGEYCLFLGLNISISIPINNYTTIGSLEKNCIYFSANRLHPSDFAQIGLPMDTDDIGVYSLEDKSVRYLYDGISGPSCSPPIWIIPTLARD